MTERVHLVSLGCPKNTVDSERMLGWLQGNEYVLTEAAEQADVVVNLTFFAIPIVDAYTQQRQYSNNSARCPCE